MSGTCAHRRCRRQITQAFDTGSWFAKPTPQNTTHYEVCDKHASYFAQPFDRQQLEAVKRDLEPYEVAPGQRQSGDSGE